MLLITGQTAFTSLEMTMSSPSITRPALRSVHRIVWHPTIGDVTRSNVHVTVEAVTSKGPWLRVPGQPVLVVDWETWGRMVANGE